MSEQSQLKSTSIMAPRLASQSRRQFIRGFSAMVGSATAANLLSPHAIAVAASYTAKADSALSNGKIFNQAQLTLLKQVCNLVIPKTSTLGAGDVDTHGFIDNQLFYCHQTLEQQTMVQVLSLIEQIAQQQFSTAFIDVDFEHQFQLINTLDRGQGSFTAQQRYDFKSLKKLICFGYYTSEVGATQELRFDAIPGGFKGSIPYNKDDASWGSKGLFY